MFDVKQCKDAVLQRLFYAYCDAKRYKERASFYASIAVCYLWACYYFNKKSSAIATTEALSMFDILPYHEGEMQHFYISKALLGNRDVSPFVAYYLSRGSSYYCSTLKQWLSYFLNTENNNTLYMQYQFLDENKKKEVKINLDECKDLITDKHILFGQINL